MDDLGNKEVFARNLQRYMDLHGRSRHDVCDALGFRYTTFTDWVTGQTYPRIDKIEMLANYFGISKADLIEDPAHRKRPVVSDADLKFSLFGGDDTITDAQFDEVKRFAMFIKERDNGRK